MDPSDKELIELELLLLRSRRGHVDAMEGLIRRFEQSLFYYIRRLMGNDADAWDALQRTWVRVLAGIDKVRDVEALKTWLYRVARNTTLNQIRSEQRYQDALRKKSEALPPLDEQMQFACENVEEVHRALDQLELPYREVLTLFFLEEMSVRNISEVIDTSEGTVKWRLHQAKNKLREVLEKHHG